MLASEHNFLHPSHGPRRDLCLKALYRWNSFQYLVAAIFSDVNFELKEYWCNFTIATSDIRTALKNTKESVARECLGDTHLKIFNTKLSTSKTVFLTGAKV